MPAPIKMITIAAWKLMVPHFFCCIIRNLKILTMSVIPNKTNKNSNHLVLKMSFCAELVPKSFSTNVATPIEIAKSKMYNPAAEVEKSQSNSFFNKFIGML